MDALLRDEEHTGKKKRKKQGLGLQPSYPRTFGHLLNLQGSYAEPILVTPSGPHMDTYIYLFIILYPKSHHCGFGAHQRQEKSEKGRKSEKREEKE